MQLLFLLSHQKILVSWQTETNIYCTHIARHS